VSILKFLKRRNTNAASIAKERLQIIISHERSQKNAPDCLPKAEDLPKLQEEILNVITKYIKINRENVSVNLERLGDSAILELNFTMQDEPEKNHTEIEV
jgi:cell division topological specificity factor